MNLIDGNQKALIYGLGTFATGTALYVANEIICTLSNKVGLTARISSFFEMGIKGSTAAGFRWTASLIASPFVWGWSCVRHPISSIANIPSRIYNIAAFIYGWSLGLAIKKTQYVLNTYLPSLRPPF